MQRLQIPRNPIDLNHRRFSRPDVPTCSALSRDGQSCHTRSEKQRCKLHHEEYKELYTEYKDLERKYQNISNDVKSLTDDQRIQKVKLGKDLIRSRQDVNHRFFSSVTTNRSHIQWILKIQAEVDTLESHFDEIIALSINGSDKAENSLQDPHVARVENKGEKVYRSLLHPQVPIEALKHLPPDHPAWVLKRSVTEVLDALIEQLYQLVPELDDRKHESSLPELDRAPLREHDQIWRYMLREFIAWNGTWNESLEALRHATKTSNIDQFLRTSFPSDVRAYIKFFKAFLDGRPDTLHFLRDAILDYIRPNGVTSQIVVLGATLNDEESEQRMTVQGWDILYQYFTPWMHWSNVEIFCTCFEDVLLIKRLIAFRRYGEISSISEEGMCDPSQDVSQEDVRCLLFGFVPVFKGYLEPTPTAQSQDKTDNEVQFRNYLTGRMAKSDPLAHLLIEELKRRLAAYSLVVYVYPSSDRTVLAETEIEPWIRRHRPSGGDLPSPTVWQTELGLKDILNDLRRITELRREDGKISDFYEFIIVDRLHGRDFMILNQVGFILGNLAKCRSYEDQAHKVIRECIPSDDQEAYISAITIDQPDDVYKGTPLPYVYARVRAWDVEESFVKPLIKMKHTSQAKVQISSILNNMEESGIISRLDKYEQPLSIPVLVQATDGNHDLYFPYICDTPKFDKEIWTKVGGNPTREPTCLYDFAKEQMKRYPTTIIAKGRVIVPYCAWPIPANDKTCPPFSSSNGYIYRWVQLPFDSIGAQSCWNFYLNRCMHVEFPFVLFWNTSFVICAKDVDDAKFKLNQVLAKAQKFALQLEVDPPNTWSGDIDRMNLDKLWEGMYPIDYTKTKNLP